MERSAFLEKLNRVEQIASSSKLSRLLNDPYKYLHAILFRKFVYPKSKQEKVLNASVFFNGEMQIALPASTDIYLTGGKSHDSEIRLARFLINRVNEGDDFLDIGAHYGYFSLLAATLTGKGEVYSFEPSPKTFALLKVNAGKRSNIKCFQEAVSDTPEPLTFYEFPNLYSEYNAMNVDQFSNKDWFKGSKPKQITVKGNTIDTITAAGFRPQLIKIDVEGAELKVISGGRFYLSTNNPYVVMEYLETERDNSEHNKAAALLVEWGYVANHINKAGELEVVKNINEYLKNSHLESDNIVFRKLVVNH
jgi:FkbM family methyltransferase